MKLILVLCSVTVITSCNNDIQIISKKDKKECRRLATCFKYLHYANDEVGIDFDSVDGNTIYPSPNIDNEEKIYFNMINEMPISNKNNLKYISKAKSLAIKNSSENKVYNVRIKRKWRDKVTYKDYEIEPLKEICIGCDTDFDLKLDYIEQEVRNPYPHYGTHLEHFLPYEGEIKKSYPVEYSIYNTKVISKY